MDNMDTSMMTSCLEDSPHQRGQTFCSFCAQRQLLQLDWEVLDLVLLDQVLLNRDLLQLDRVLSACPHVLGRVRGSCASHTLLLGAFHVDELEDLRVFVRWGCVKVHVAYVLPAQWLSFTRY